MAKWMPFDDGSLKICWHLLHNEEIYIQDAGDHSMFVGISFPCMCLDRSQVADLHRLLGYWLEHGELPTEMESSGNG